jgi:hypothetical protein
MASKWIRTEQPDELKINLGVNKQSHPFLYNWLWNLPRGKGSAAVRDLLEQCLKQQTGQATTQATPVPESASQNRPVAPPAESRQPSAVAVESLAPAPVARPLVEPDSVSKPSTQPMQRPERTIQVDKSDAPQRTSPPAMSQAKQEPRPIEHGSVVDKPKLSAEAIKQMNQIMGALD